MKKRSTRKSSSLVRAPKRDNVGALIKRNTEQIQLSPSRPARAKMLARAHPAIVGGVPYALLAERMMAENDELSALSAPAALTFIKEMCPRDGLEQLAVSQALLAHARASWLTQLMTRQTHATTL